LKIGIFDSGIGGLTVLHRALRELPEEDYLFYADADHVPYGEKTKEEITGYASAAVGFLAERGAKAVVVACNTATSVAIGTLRASYPIPILGIEPAVKPAVEETDGRRILVVATPVTVREEKLHNLIARVDAEHLVDLLALPRLVPFAEKGEFRSPEVSDYLRREFSRYDLSAYSSLVLGCTHFNYFKDTFRELLPRGADILDGCAGTVNHLADVLRERGLLERGGGAVEYFRSGRRIPDGPELARIGGLLRRLDEMERI
jgi:glutamate racemase